jgi:hypothetical protein
MSLTPLKAGRVVKEGVNLGNQGGEVNCLAQHLEVEAGWPREAAAWPGSAGARWKIELTSGTHLAVTEGEGVVTELRKRAKETYFGNTPLPRRLGWAERVRGLRERRPVAGWAERPGGPAGRWGDWAESEGKFFSK